MMGPGDTVFANNPFDDGGPGGMGPMGGQGMMGGNAQELMMAQNEVAVLKKLKHPHAICVVEAFTDVPDETLCIVMEYADGKDLDTLLRQRKQQRKPFTEAEVLKIFYVDCMSFRATVGKRG